MEDKNNDMKPKAQNTKEDASKTLSHGIASYKNLQETVASALDTPANRVLRSIAFQQKQAIIPTVETLAEIGKAVADSDLPKYDFSGLGLALTQFSELYLSTTTSTIQQLSSSVENVMKRYAASAYDVLENITSSMQSIASQLVRYEVTSVFDSLKDVLLTFDPKQYETEYYEIMLESRWFPYAIHNIGISAFIDINDIVAHTRASDNRIKKIDRCIFSYYKKSDIEEIRKTWRNTDTPKWTLKTLNQAVRAYHRKEYALTVITLVSLWEGIVSEKAAYSHYRIVKKTKENFAILIDSNSMPQVIADYFNDYVMYDCYSKNDLIQDTPGRHGVTHGWWSRYPSQKTALNAILFTDFLLKLHPVESEEE